MRRDTSVVAAIAVLALAQSACVSSKVEQFREAPTRSVQIAKGESVVILSRGQHGDRETESDFNTCLASALIKEGLPVMAEQVLVDALYPWLEPRTAPLNADALPTLLDRPGVEAKIRAAGVRYMIWIDGQSEVTGSAGGLSCAVGPGFAGCFGFGMWDKESAYRAEVWDLNQRSSVGKVSTRSTGTSYVPAFIVPIPLIARTQTAACDGAAEQLVDLVKPG
ncbi:hypothetical protein [Nevskia sp.]|uniref:hypothetical protein n=1 Tax=Nevskia sp. TaxID=1929292 RepID=UPI0025EE24B1|nr:hypothetical protein [Nevskia sp.]